VYYTPSSIDIIYEIYTEYRAKREKIKLDLIQQTGFEFITIINDIESN